MRYIVLEEKAGVNNAILLTTISRRNTRCRRRCAYRRVRPLCGARDGKRSGGSGDGV